MNYHQKVIFTALIHLTVEERREVIEAAIDYDKLRMEIAEHRARTRPDLLLEDMLGGEGIPKGREEP